MLQQLQAAFDAFPNNSVSKENFTGIVKITGLPLYWRMPLFHCTQLTPAGLVDGRRFCDFWKQYVSLSLSLSLSLYPSTYDTLSIVLILHFSSRLHRMSVFCHDTVSRFVFILSRGQRSRSYILPEDLVTLVQDVVDTHPGLAFLKEASEFHSRYVHTVIARIYYTVNRCWSGKITIPELRRSDFLQVRNAISLLILTIIFHMFF
jgi:serine/threonine-protein phosphatase 2A regulatory subunit B''